LIFNKVLSPDLTTKYGAVMSGYLQVRASKPCGRVRLSESEHGFDAGIQQSLFKLLEHPQPPCAPDWTLHEAVDGQARREATAGAPAASKDVPHRPGAVLHRLRLKRLEADEPVGVDRK
jgi:hypothetical protein